MFPRLSYVYVYVVSCSKPISFDGSQEIRETLQFHPPSFAKSKKKCIKMIDEHWMDVGRGLWFSRSTWFVWNEADFSSQTQRVVQFIQGNMKVLGIPISVCLTSVLYCGKISTNTNVWNEADFSSRMQRVVQFIQENMKVLGIVSMSIFGQ